MDAAHPGSPGCRTNALHIFRRTTVMGLRAGRTDRELFQLNQRRTRLMHLAQPRLTTLIMVSEKMSENLQKLMGLRRD